MTMCECNHHWLVHALSGQTAPERPCWGYTGSATPGPYEPCPCAGFRQWAGPRDSRTGEPVRPLTMTVDARPGVYEIAELQRRTELALDATHGQMVAEAVAEARDSERQRIRHGSQLRHDMGTNIAGIQRYYAVPAALLDGAS